MFAGPFIQNLFRPRERKIAGMAAPCRMKLIKPKQRGTALYETLLSLPILLMLVFLGIKGMVLSYRALVLQYASGQAVRKLALEICNGPKADQWGHPDPTAPINETTVCPSGAGTDVKKRAKYAYDYARLVSFGFGLPLADYGVHPTAKNALTACIMSSANVSTCSSFPHRLDGIASPNGIASAYGIMFLKTASGLGGFSLTGSSTETGPITGFEGRSTSDLSAIAVVRIERQG